MTENRDFIDDEIDEHLNSDIYTPESIAWKLLIEEELKEIKQGQLIGFLDESYCTNKLEALTVEFEILITIYMEMVIGWYKLLYLMENTDEKQFKLNLDLLKIDDLLNPFKEKMLVLGYILNISEINNLKIYEEFKKNSYCRIALRDLKEDTGFFIINNKNIPKDKKYHFILNSAYEDKNNIRDIYAVIKINNIGYKINFVKAH